MFGRACEWLSPDLQELPEKSPAANTAVPTSPALTLPAFNNSKPGSSESNLMFLKNLDLFIAYLILLVVSNIFNYVLIY